MGRTFHYSFADPSHSLSFSNFRSKQFEHAQMWYRAVYPASCTARTSHRPNGSGGPCPLTRPDDVDVRPSAVSNCQSLLARSVTKRGPSMGRFIRIGVDLAKNNFRVHAFASDGAPAVKRKLTRSKMHRFFSQIEATWALLLTRLVLPTKRL